MFQVLNPFVLLVVFSCLLFAPPSRASDRVTGNVVSVQCASEAGAWRKKGGESLQLGCRTSNAREPILNTATATHAA